MDSAAPASAISAVLVATAKPVDIAPIKRIKRSPKKLGFVRLKIGTAMLGPLLSIVNTNVAAHIPRNLDVLAPRKRFLILANNPIWTHSLNSQFGTKIRRNTDAVAAP
jgi:hypothetical protein